MPVRMPAFDRVFAFNRDSTVAPASVSAVRTHPAQPAPEVKGQHENRRRTQQRDHYDQPCDHHQCDN
ncbi:MAG: hypothetical protein KGL00_06685, partial [Gammaproteobacteria bacterium]|nr:hypothetical protein [Gammaproteobacteria bacterium]